MYTLLTERNILDVMRSSMGVATLVCICLLSGCAGHGRTGNLGIEEVHLPSQESSALYGETVAGIGEVLLIEDEVLASQLEEWQCVNSDVCAMLRITDLNICEPVVEATVDNKQWLRTNIYGEEDVAGVVFLDYRCDVPGTLVKLVHGHNMKDGTMFAAIPDLLFLESCQDAPLIELYYGTGSAVYEVFSVVSVDATKEALPIDIMANSNEVSLMLNDLRERSIVPGGVLHSVDVVVLNTCWYGESGTERNLHCIVAASRVVR